MSKKLTKGPVQVTADQPETVAGNPVISIIIPKAFQSSKPSQLYKPGTPGRLLVRLARDHFCKQPTLTREQLAELIELFKDEPLPDTLRAAVVADLNGNRSLKQGRKEIQLTLLELVEMVMLPTTYDMAMEEAAHERERLKAVARDLPRRTSVMDIPTKRSIALDLVRKWLPTLKGKSDRSLSNLISNVRRTHKDEAAIENSDINECKP